MLHVRSSVTNRTMPRMERCRGSRIDNNASHPHLLTLCCYNAMVVQLRKLLLHLCFSLLAAIATSAVGTFDLSIVIVMIQTIFGPKGFPETLLCTWHKYRLCHQ